MYVKNGGIDADKKKDSRHKEGCGYNQERMRSGKIRKMTRKKELRSVANILVLYIHVHIHRMQTLIQSVLEVILKKNLKPVSFIWNFVYTQPKKYMYMYMYIMSWITRSEEDTYIDGLVSQLTLTG